MKSPCYLHKIFLTFFIFKNKNLENYPNIFFYLEGKIFIKIVISLPFLFIFHKIRYRSFKKVSFEILRSKMKISIFIYILVVKFYRYIGIYEKYMIKILTKNIDEA